MFDHDRSAARGLMNTRQIVVFEHETALGNKSAHELFDRVTWKRTTEGPARDYNDYEILLDNTKIDLKERFKIVKVS
jgi:CRISPR-associated protein Csd2